jgi:hypothetical protein
MSETNPRIERMLRELRSAPSARFFEIPFAVTDACVRFAAGFGRRLAPARATGESVCDPDVLQPQAKESP